MPQTTWALFETTSFVRIPSSLSGLSGLLFTQSIDTLSPGKLEVGLGLVQEESDRPAFSVSRYFSTFTLGLTKTIEVSAQVPYFAKVDAIKMEQGITTELDESAIGDVNLSMKWRFLESNSEFNLPGFGLSLTAVLPTGKRELGAGSVDSWGVKVLLVSSAELEIIVFSPYAIPFGIYANGGIYAEDLSDEAEKEAHGIIDLGFLLPLNESAKIQLLLEGNARMKRDTPFGGEYTAVTTGLRYVSRHVTLNGGWQHRFNKIMGNKKFDDSDLFMLYVSYDF